MSDDNYLSFPEVQARDFFNQNIQKYDEHDKYFSGFSDEWMTLLKGREYVKAEMYWRKVITCAEEWEKSNQKRIHKGTPYYLWAVSKIMLEDFDFGFLLMHKAVEEDRLSFPNNYAQKPAYSFVTLEYLNINQLYRAKVQSIANFLELKIKAYNNKYSRNLQLNELSQRFLRDSFLFEEVFLLVYSCFVIGRMENPEVRDNLLKSNFASILLSRILFNLCLIIENFIQQKSPNLLNLSQKFEELAKKTPNTTISTSKRKEVQTTSNNNLEETLKKLLDGTFKYVDGTEPTSFDCSVIVTYLFRNFGAHEISALDIVHSKFQQLLQCVFDSFFMSIEHF